MISRKVSPLAELGCEEQCHLALQILTLLCCITSIVDDSHIKPLLDVFSVDVSFLYIFVSV